MYKFFEGGNEFGIVVLNEDGSVRRTKEFMTLEEMLKEANEDKTPDQELASLQQSADWRGSFPPLSSSWLATS